MNVSTFTPGENLIIDHSRSNDAAIETILRYNQTLKQPENGGNGKSWSHMVPLHAAPVLREIWELPQEDEAWQHL